MDGWVWSNGGMILTGEMTSQYRTYIVRLVDLMDEYGASFEWY